MEVKLCKTVCKNCPFKKENSHKLYLDQVKRNFADDRFITPCHMDMVKYTGIENKGVELYAEVAEEFKVCRGMVLSRMRSGVHPKGIYQKLYQEVGYAPCEANKVVKVEL